MSTPRTLLQRQRRALVFVEFQQNSSIQLRKSIRTTRLIMWILLMIPIGLTLLMLYVQIIIANSTQETIVDQTIITILVGCLIAVILRWAFAINGKKKTVLRILRDPAKQPDLEDFYIDHIQPVWMTNPKDYFGEGWLQWLEEGSARSGR